MNSTDNVCIWSKHPVYMDVWITQCGHQVESIQGRTPLEIGVKECVWCNKKLKEKQDE